MVDEFAKIAVGSKLRELFSDKRLVVIVLSDQGGVVGLHVMN